MVLKDLFITPFYLVLLSTLAFLIRPFVTNRETRRYFMLALFVRFLGAISLGFIYQFYYGGGDTFTFFHLGSRWVWEAFLFDPVLGLKMIFGEMSLDGDVFQFASRIYTYGDSASYSVVRLAGFFDILTFHTYSATALFFAVLSFSGVWMIYQGFQTIFPNHTRVLTYSILFFPSLVFWGSGVLKDSVTIAAVGWVFFGLVQVLYLRKNYLFSVILIALGFYTLMVIKIYILLCLLPALLFWIYLVFRGSIKSLALRIAFAPFLLAIFSVFAYYSVIRLGEESHRYSVEDVLITAEETAKWNYFVSNRSEGSGYTLGDFDFTPTALAIKFVPAVLTTFFRPFIFEVRNPLMLLSALENLIVLWLFLKVMFSPKKWKLVFKDPVLVFSLVFAILFAFSIGVTTYNFGSLARYKIPMLPFLASTLAILASKNRHL